MSKKYHNWLKQLTATPTAAGQEWRVVEWVEKFVASRKELTMTADKAGNLTIKRKNARSRKPIYITAHMDHPAFVCKEVLSDDEMIAEFRGSVNFSYFLKSHVNLYHKNKKAQRGQIVEVTELRKSANLGTADAARYLRIKFEKKITAAPFDVLTWDVGPTVIKGDRLHTLACDDLAAVAAAFAAYEQLLKKTDNDVRLLMTVAEEMAFVGAIAACKEKSIPKGARLICLENSKSFAESPIGGGPIVRVGDYTSTFDSDLTYRISQIAAQTATADSSFKWQRKLMPGGTCEASAFGAYGYISTCLCLPLGNYHNMNVKTKKIEPETISVSDFDGLVRLLIEVGCNLDDPKLSPGLKPRLEQIYKERSYVLND